MSKQVYCNVATSFDTPYLMEPIVNTSLWKTFGAWIKDNREKNRMSQATAARRAGIDRQQWYRIESGKSGTKRNTVIAMAKAVSADVGEALHKAGFAQVDTEPRTRIQKLMDALEAQGIDGMEMFGGFNQLANMTDEQYEDLLKNVFTLVQMAIERAKIEQK